MTSHRPGRTSWVGRLILAALMGAIVALLVTEVGKSATSAAASRCRPIVTESSIAYRCWSAYPESFSVVGVAFSKYRIDWSVTCDGKTVKGRKTDSGGIAVLVGRATEHDAYQLMDNSTGVCKVNVAAKRVSGHGSIAVELIINQNHPSPAHN